MRSLFSPGALVLSLSFAIFADAQARSVSYELNIPRQTLGSALEALAQATGLQVGLFSDRVNGAAMVGPVSGRYTSDEALRILLAPEGLTYRVLNEQAIVVLRPQDLQVSPTSQRGDRRNTGQPPTAAPADEGGEVQGLSAQRALHPDWIRVAQTGGIVSQSAPVVPPVSKEPESSQLQEITVTAQKTAQNAQAIPLAISAFTAQDLESRQVFGLEAVKYLVPNLVIEPNLSNVGTPKIFMRGVGQANSAFSFDSPIGIYVDDVYYAKEVGSLVDFYDIDRIEVLRGPQGTIYGRNNSVGAIRIVTKSAPLDRVDAVGDVSFGSQDQRNARMSFGLPLITDTVGLRVAFNSKYNSGFETNTVNGERTDSDNSNAVRAQLLAKIADNLSLTVRGDYLRDNSRPAVGIDFKTGDLDSFSYASSLLYSDGAARSRLETFGSSATLNWQLADIKLTSVSAWRGVNTINSWDADGTTKPTFELRSSDLTDRSVTQEVFASGSSIAAQPLDWVGGIFYLHEKTHYLYSLEIFTPASVQNFNQTVESVAGYLQATYHLTEQLGLTAGGRYTTEHKDFDVLSHLPDGSFDFAYSNHDLSTNKWTWRAALDYQATRDVLAYASAQTGFRSGGLNGNASTLADVTGGAFQPEDSKFYELGVKSELADRRVRINADYYFGKYNHLQTAVVQDNGLINSTNSTAKVNGLELEAKVLPTAGLELSATVGTLNQQIQGSSKDLPDAPRLIWNLAGLYSHSLSRFGTFSAGTQYSYTGSSFTNAANTPQIRVGAHANVDAHVSLTSADEHWQFTLAGLNLTDKIYATGGFYIAGGAIASTEWPSLPRRWLLSAQYRY